MRLLALTLIAGLVAGFCNAQEKITATAAMPVTPTGLNITSGTTTISAYTYSSYSALYEFWSSVDTYHNLYSSGVVTPTINPSLSFVLPANTLMSYRMPAYTNAAFQARNASGELRIQRTQQ